MRHYTRINLKSSNKNRKTHFCGIKSLNYLNFSLKMLEFILYDGEYFQQVKKTILKF